MPSDTKTAELEPTADELRELIVSDHRRFRKELEGLVELLDRETIEMHGEARDAIASRFADFAEEFLAHLALEDTYLTPRLAEDYAWGAIRARELGRHHAEQRREVLNIIAELEHPALDTPTFVARVRRFVTHVELDMLAEEGGILSPEILRDSPVSVEIGA